MPAGLSTYKVWAHDSSQQRLAGVVVEAYAPDTGLTLQRATTDKTGHASFLITAANIGFRVLANRGGADDSGYASTEISYENTGGVVPVGGIILWPNTAGAIPTGYHLCDGTAGTPDWRDRTVVCAGGFFVPGFTSGLITGWTGFTHTFYQHNHTFNNVLINYAGGALPINIPISEQLDFGHAHDQHTVPSFVTAYYIQRLF